LGCFALSWSWETSARGRRPHDYFPKKKEGENRKKNQQLRKISQNLKRIMQSHPLHRCIDTVSIRKIVFFGAESRPKNRRNTNLNTACETPNIPENAQILRVTVEFRVRTSGAAAAAAGLKPLAAARPFHRRVVWNPSLGVTHEITVFSKVIQVTMKNSFGSYRKRCIIEP